MYRGECKIWHSKYKFEYKIYLLDLKLQEINYAFISSDYRSKYYRKYVEEDKLFFHREKPYFGIISRDEYYDRRQAYWKKYPGNKGNYISIYR